MNVILEHPLAEDLDHVLQQTPQVWERLRGGRLFITGGTGFVGRWLLDSFLWAREKLRLEASVVVLTRNPSAFRQAAPQAAGHAAVELCEGDVRSFRFPAGSFTHVIHAATDASAALNIEHPWLMIETIVDGTRRVLDFARQAGASQVLFLSSGAVYGPQPPLVSHLEETYPGAPLPDDPAAAYGEGKRLAEVLCASAHRQFDLDVKIARGFAFVGPYLPLDAHFAVGNFIRDGLTGDPIRMRGDGRPYRSYLYAADLAVWLWQILVRGRAGVPYNVGSEAAVTIAELAQVVAECAEPPCRVEVAHPAGQGLPERYVPSVQRARQELGLRQTVNLREAVRKTWQWHVRQQGHS